MTSEGKLHPDVTPRPDPASIYMEYYAYDPAAGWSEITADDYVFLTIDTLEHPDIYDGWRIAVVTDAKQLAKRMLSDEWASTATEGRHTHKDLRTRKAEVRVNGECVWDTFYSGSAK